MESGDAGSSGVGIVSHENKMEVENTSTCIVRYELDGHIYSIPRCVVEKHPDSVLAQCLMADPDEQPEVIPIKRDGTWFTFIIKYMREASLDNTELTFNQVMSIEKEADFLGLTELVKYCQNRLKGYIEPELQIVHYLSDATDLNKFGKASVLIHYFAVRNLDLDSEIRKLAKICGENNCPIYYVEYIRELKKEDKSPISSNQFVILWEVGIGYTLKVALEDSIANLLNFHKTCSSDLLRTRLNLSEFMLELQRKFSKWQCGHSSHWRKSLTSSR